MAKSFVFQNTKDFAISPYKNFKMFKSVFENQFSPWKNKILHPDFFLTRYGPVLAKNRNYPIPESSGRTGQVFRSKNIQLQPFFWRAPHMKSDSVGCLGSVGTPPLRVIAFGRSVLWAPWADFNNFWFFGKFRASSACPDVFLVFLNQTCLFQNQISKISCVFLEISFF